MYKIDYHKRVIKFLVKQDLKFKNQVLDTFEKIALNPYVSTYDIKPLKDSDSVNTKFRLRIGKYRFIYKIVDSQLLIKVADAGSRGDIYK